MSFPELKLRTGKGRVSLEGSRRESLSWPFPASGGVFVHLLARVGPSIFKASSTASSNHCSIFTCPLLSPAPLLKGPCDYTQKPCRSSRVISHLKTLNWVPSAKFPLPHKVAFTGCRDDGRTSVGATLGHHSSLRLPLNHSHSKLFPRHLHKWLHALEGAFRTVSVLKPLVG